MFDKRLKLLASILTMLILISVLSLSGVSASDIPDGLEYSIVRNSVMITKYTGNAKKVVIPDTIKGYPVTSIFDSAFYSDKLESVVIPDTVTDIFQGAFAGCPNLTKIQLPPSVSYIGKYAFLNTAFYNNPDNWTGSVLYCGTALIDTNFSTPKKNYTIKESTTVIASYAFTQGNIANLTFPPSVKYVSSGAFTHCASLNSVTFLGDVEQELEPGLFFYSADHLTVYGPAGSSIERFARNEGLKFITTENTNLYKIGDVNFDYSINIRDATAIQKHVAELVTLEAKAEAVADFDGDTKITVKDATAIQKFVAGLL